MEKVGNWNLGNAFFFACFHFIFKAEVGVLSIKSIL